MALSDNARNAGPRVQHKDTVRTAHLAIPVTRCRTTFAGGVNPWGLVT